MTHSSERLQLAMSNQEYLSLDKTFGSIDSDVLFDLTEVFHLTPDSIKTEVDYSIAASALIEAAIFYPDENDEFLDTRLFCIDEAMELLATASKLEYDHLEKGHKAADNQADWIRLEVQRIFENVYKDLITKDLTPQTQAETLADLMKWGTYAKKHASFAPAYSRDLLGVANEIARLATIWQLKEPSLIAIPSTVRGGHGSLHAEQTHDAVIIELDENGAIQRITSREYKRGSKNIKSDIQRYVHPIDRGSADNAITSPKQLRKLGSITLSSINTAA